MDERSKSMPQDSPETNSKEDLLLDHAYDGIQEFDNPMPAWWKNTFWATFIFSLGYLFYYHLSQPGDPVMAEYRAAVSAHEAVAAQQALNNPVSEESLKALVTNTAATAAGAAVFEGKCSPCHGKRGEGLIGPNLTDDHWIHGKATLMDLHKVISVGVAEKGMPAWERQLSPDELRKVVAFVGTMVGTNVKGKAPEGTKVN